MTENASRGSRGRVLVVDDSPTVLQLLRALLEAEEYEVVTASNGAEGLEKARQARPDLVVTDTVMPEMDGVALVKALRREPVTHLIPVIILTSGEPDDEILQDAGLGPDGILSKSHDLDQLLDRIRRGLDKASRDK